MIKQCCIYPTNWLRMSPLHRRFGDVAPLQAWLVHRFSRNSRNSSTNKRFEITIFALLNNSSLWTVFRPHVFFINLIQVFFFRPFLLTIFWLPERRRLRASAHAVWGPRGSMRARRRSHRLGEHIRSWLGREVVLLNRWEDDRLRCKVTVLAHEPYYRAWDETKHVVSRRGKMCNGRMGTIRERGARGWQGGGQRKGAMVHLWGKWRCTTMDACGKLRSFGGRGVSR